VELLGRGDLVVEEHLLKGCETLQVAEECSLSECPTDLKSWQMPTLPGGLAMLCREEQGHGEGAAVSWCC